MATHYLNNVFLIIKLFQLALNNIMQMTQHNYVSWNAQWNRIYMQIHSLKNVNHLVLAQIIIETTQQWHVSKYALIIPTILQI